MTIAILTDGIYPYVIGGMQRHSFYLTKYLASEGWMVDLYHTNQSEKNISNLDVFSDAEKQNIRSFVIEFPSLGFTPGHYIRESYEYSVRIWNVFKMEKKPDFIIVKGFAGWELLNQKSKGIKLPPVGINFHGYEMFQPQPNFFSFLKSRLLFKSPVLFNVKNADYLFSYGGKITDILKKLSVSTDKILEIPAGIDADWINEVPLAATEIRKFVFLGRYERRKGIKELGKVLQKLISENANFEFHFIGQIPKTKEMHSAKIAYHGLITDNIQLKNLLREMDVLVCPSYSEGMPNVVLEGLASGLAVIATDVGATSSMVNETNGWLIPFANQTKLYDAIKSAIEINPLLLDEKKCNAVQFVKENLLWNKIVKKTMKIIVDKVK